MTLQPHFWHMWMEIIVLVWGCGDVFYLFTQFQLILLVFQFVFLAEVILLSLVNY